MIPRKYFPVFTRVRIQAPHVFATKSIPQELFPACIGFLLGGSCLKCCISKIGAEIWEVDERRRFQFIESGDSLHGNLLNCLFCRFPYQSHRSLNAKRSFSSLISASSHPLSQTPLQRLASLKQNAPNLKRSVFAYLQSHPSCDTLGKPCSHQGGDCSCKLLTHSHPLENPFLVKRVCPCTYKSDIV